MKDEIIYVIVTAIIAFCSGVLGASILINMYLL